MNRETLIRARGHGDRVGHAGALIPGPGHTNRDRSLSVTFDTGHPRGYRFKSFAGDADKLCLNYLDSLVGRTFQPGERRVEQPGPRPQHAYNAEAAREVERRQGRAGQIWREAVPCGGTPAEAWLNGRGLDLPAEVDGDVLRFHRRCPWNDDDGRTILVPAMIALVRNIRTDAPQAIHRTRLDVKDRRMLGPFAGGVIKIDADKAVGQGLILGEGVETCLSGRQMGLRPVWATGSAGGIASFGPLPGVECLTILGEVGDGGVNARASDACANLWRATGAEVIVLEPQTGADANDVLKAGVRHG